VAGRRVLFTTTNGTRALQHANAAQRVVIGAMVNLSAVVASVKGCPRVDVLCAGTGGLETREDVLAAGAIVHCLCLPESGAWQLGDDAEAARRAWQSLLSAAQAAGRTPSDELALELRDTPGGRNLLAIGMDADLVVCAQSDALDVVPEFDRDSGRIHLP